VATKLLRWFEGNRRDFPWRRTFEDPDPYVILFTEIMLQRTRASQVVPFYSDFFRKYPTFKRLAKAERQEVVSRFEKLGLRWRARKVWNLITSLNRQYRGRIPSELEELKKLPGVGDYVARAVYCYAFGGRTAPLDSNVVRIVSRLFGIAVSSDSARRSKTISDLTVSLIPPRKEREFNLALLDFGALVCKPRPLCSICPLRDICEYYRTLVNRS
jgi:A/G-specific adenine glycosylase